MHKELYAIFLMDYIGGENMIDIKIKRLSETAILPTKAHITDACFDIYANCPNDIFFDWDKREDINGVRIEPGQAVTIHTGFATTIPEGYFASVFPRSGMGIKRHLRLSNSTGIIDCSYTGEWMVALYNDGNETQVIKHGDRIAQFALLPVLDVQFNEVNELDETERGSGGFGSSGR